MVLVQVPLCVLQTKVFCGSSPNTISVSSVIEISLFAFSVSSSSRPFRLLIYILSADKQALKICVYYERDELLTFILFQLRNILPIFRHHCVRGDTSPQSLTWSRHLPSLSEISTFNRKIFDFHMNLSVGKQVRSGPVYNRSAAYPFLSRGGDHGGCLFLLWWFEKEKQCFYHQRHIYWLGRRGYFTRKL